MDVNQRKMFKTRPARDKLNRMGGIMASSAPLMNTVAQYNSMYNMGGPVGYKNGDVVRIPTRGRGFVMRPGTGVGPGYVNKFPMVIDQPKIPGVLSRTIRGVPGLSTAASAVEQRIDPFDYQAIAQRVAPYQGRQNTASGITREQFDAMGPAQQQAYVDRFNASRYITESIPAQLRQGFSIVTDPAQDLLEGIASTEIGQRLRGFISPETADVPFEETPRRRNELAAIEDQARNRPLTASQFRLSLPSSEPEVGTDRATTEEQYMMGPGAAAPEPTMPTPDLTQEDRDNEARVAAPTEDETDYLDTFVPENLDEGDLLSTDAITEEKRIQEIVNSDDKELQQGELKRLMAEFTENAPQYEGMGKGLAIAKIGFAMAAGQSPNAITNIASALSDGADMLIKDKKDRDAFDRQLQLSALQYGLTEVGKKRAEQRLIDREGRALKTYYNKEGESITITVDELRENGVPKDFGEPELIKAALEREDAAIKSIDDAIKNGIVSGKDGRKESENYQKSVGNIIGAETAIGLLEGAYIDVVEGKVTGGAPALKTLLERGGNIFGIELGKEYKSADAARDAFRFGLQKVIPVTVGATQSANSISDRDVNLLITALFGPGAIEGGVFSLVDTDPELMAERIGRAIREIRVGQRSELANLQSIESRLSGGFMPGSSRKLGVTSALTQIAPFQEQLLRAGFTSEGRPTASTAGLVKVGEKNGIPVFGFQN